MPNIAQVEDMGGWGNVMYGELTDRTLFCLTALKKCLSQSSQGDYKILEKRLGAGMERACNSLVLLAQVIGGP